MIKYKLLLFAFLSIFSLFSFGQKSIKDSVYNVYDLNTYMYKSWQNIESVWYHNDYKKCLTENKLKLSCESCESIIMVVNFNIDSTGKISDYKIISDKMCNKRFTPQLKVRFLEFFLNFIFPPELRSIMIQVRLGDSLKC